MRARLPVKPPPCATAPDRGHHQRRGVLQPAAQGPIGLDGFAQLGREAPRRDDAAREADNGDAFRARG